MESMFVSHVHVVRVKAERLLICFCSQAVPEHKYLIIKALLGMLARLPWGRRYMLGSMDGKHRGV